MMLCTKVGCWTVLLACLSLSGVDFGSPAISRVAKLNREASLSLVERDGARCVIVSAPDATPVAKFAAKELQQFMEQSTGVKIPLVSTPEPDKISILVGGGALAREAGVDVEALPRDSFVIRSVGSGIVIAGRDDVTVSPEGARRPWNDYYERATLFAVYDFLERFLGVRFVFPGEIGTVVPTHRTLEVPGMEILERPDNTVRSISPPEGHWYDPKGGEFDKRLLNYRLRMQTTYIPNCHGLGRMAYIERFGKSHPEYFALKPNGLRSNELSERMGGQLCFSSNIREEIYQDAKAFLQGKDARERKIYHDRYKSFVWDQNAAMPGFFNLMPQDGMQPCRCSMCRTLAARSPEWESIQVWEMTCQIANRLKKEGVGGYVTQMAYGAHAKVPPFDIPDNVLVMVAPMGPWAASRPELWTEQMRFVREWQNKLGRKLWLWTYVTKYAGNNIPDIPCSTPEAVARYYAEIQSESFGSFMETSSDRSIFQVFNWYVFGKMMWDSSVNGKELLVDLYHAMFGSAAPQMELFFQRIEQNWLTRIAGKTVMTPTGPESVPPTAHELWQEIYNQEELEKLADLLSAAEKSVAGHPDELKRVRFMRKHFLEVIREARMAFEATQRSAAALRLNVPAIPIDAIKLDGIPDEAVWDKAAGGAMGGMNGRPTQVGTVVKLLRDLNYLYLSIRSVEPRMDECFRQRLERDDTNLWTNNSVEVFISPDGRTDRYFQWMINQNGDFADLEVTKNGVSKFDASWNSGAEVKTADGDSFWTLEMRVPLSALPGLKPEAIAANFTRSRVLKSDNTPTRYYSWSPFVKSYHDPDGFGRLSFADNMQTNLIKDGNFNVAMKGRNFGAWVTSAETVKFISFDEENFLFEGRSLRIDNPDGRTLSAVQFPVGVKPGKRYRLTVFIRAKIESLPNPYGGVFLQFNDGKNRAFPAPAVQTSTPWTAYTYTVTPGQEKCYLQLLNITRGSAWFDGIVMEEML